MNERPEQLTLRIIIEGIVITLRFVGLLPKQSRGLARRRGRGGTPPTWADLA
jgi:hypothetical protein